VEAQVPYRGSVRDIVHQLCGGLASGISYCGAFTVPEMQQKARFVKITVFALCRVCWRRFNGWFCLFQGAGKKESGAHDVELIQ
jgi:hypothetical protein